MESSVAIFLGKEKTIASTPFLPKIEIHLLMATSFKKLLFKIISKFNYINIVVVT